MEGTNNPPYPEQKQPGPSPGDVRRPRLLWAIPTLLLTSDVVLHATPTVFVHIAKHGMQEHKMDPAPDYGLGHYKGSGKLKGKVRTV